ncbi:MAG: tyrosine-type recombinase/integrase [Helicobacteraceae bacterium]|jgi:integrase|nr:tyrosine-type recombinase/integrase [Helicobacteraceae bacterium]
MAYGKLIKTQYEGIYAYHDKHQRKVFVACFMVDRKSHRKTIGYEGDRYGMTAKKAFVIKEELRRRIEEGDNKTPIKKKTLNEVFELYLESITPIESSKTIDNKRYNYGKHIEPYAAKLPIESLDSAFWQQIINRILAAGLAPPTADKIKNTIKKVYDYAISRQWATKNPTLEINLPQYDDSVEVNLTLDESKRLYETITTYPHPIFRGVFTFLLYGRRLNEVLSLTWKMIDREANIYEIPPTINKARKNMIYRLTPLLLDALKLSPTQTGLVFPSPATGKKIVNTRYTWQCILRKAEIKKPLRFHDLRHLLGILAANNGLSEVILAAILGHTTTRITKRYYQVQTDIAAQGIEKIHKLRTN